MSIFHIKNSPFTSKFSLSIQIYLQQIEHQIQLHPLNCTTDCTQMKYLQINGEHEITWKWKFFDVFTLKSFLSHEYD